MEYEIKILNKILKKASKIAEIVSQNLFSAIKLNDELIENFINTYIKKIEPQLVKVAVDKNDNVICFAISMSSLSLAI